MNKARAVKLKLDILEQGVKDKLSIIKKLCKKYKISLENIAYVGDDINDLDAIKAVGFGCSVSNGMPDAKAIAKYVTQTPGGSGAIREIIDVILKNEQKNNAYEL